MNKKNYSKNPQEQLQVNFVQQTHLLQVEKNWGKIRKKHLTQNPFKNEKPKRVNKLEKNKQKTTLFKNKTHAKDN